MKISVHGRRFFLTGTGAALAIPFLSSLAPRGARAGGLSTVRYIQIFNTYGVTTQQFYGDLTAAEQEQPYVGVRPLADVAGSISPMVGPAFDSLRSKISLLHGLDVQIENPNHHMCFPTCASGYAAGVDNDEAPPLSGQPSVDVMMANSSKVYDASVPQARRVMVLNPVETDGYSSTRSFSWQVSATGAIEMIRPTKTTIGLQDILSSGFGGAEDPDAERLLDAVHADYQRVRDGGRISSDDKQRLEAYMALVHEIAAGAGTCDAPPLDDEANIETTVSNQFKLLAAAMACDITRVASITLGLREGGNPRHGEHHDLMHTDGASGTGLYQDIVEVGERVAELMTVMDALPDLAGTLLDSSIVYWSMQYGNARPGDSHRPWNMPVLVGGGASGQLRTGVYVDYRKDGHLTDHNPRGIPINNLLVTFMNCMGLSSVDYEANGKIGYGYYKDAFFDNPDRPDPEFWSSTEGRRSALPSYYLGPERG